MTPDEPTVGEVARTFRRRWPMIASTALVLGAIGFALASTATTQFTATTSVLVDAEAAGDVRQDDRRLMNLRSIAVSVSNGSSGAGVVVEAAEGADILHFRATASTSTAAVAGADDAADAFAEAVRRDAEQEVSAAKDLAEQRLEALHGERALLVQPLAEFDAALADGLGFLDPDAARLQRDSMAALIEADLRSIDARIASARSQIADREAALDELLTTPFTTVLVPAAERATKVRSPLAFGGVLGAAVGLLLGVLLALASEARRPQLEPRRIGSSLPGLLFVVEVTSRSVIGVSTARRADEFAALRYCVERVAGPERSAIAWTDVSRTHASRIVEALGMTEHASACVLAVSSLRTSFAGAAPVLASADGAILVADARSDSVDSIERACRTVSALGTTVLGLVLVSRSRHQSSDTVWLGPAFAHTSFSSGTPVGPHERALVPAQNGGGK